MRSMTDGALIPTSRPSATSDALASACKARINCKSTESGVMPIYYLILLVLLLMCLTRLYHASGNLVSHHAVTMDGAGVWHYKCVFEDWLHERLADPSWGGVDSQRVVDRLLGWFGAGRLAHVQGAPVGAAEGSSDALLAFEDAP